jgi:outer membrane protein assembly factor BamA
MIRPAIFILFLLLIVGCTTSIPREKLFYPLANGESAEEIKVVTIPLPVIAASPNEGVTSGALAAFLLHNNRDEVTSLVAPQINYNPNFGMTYTLYGAFYPSKQRSAEINLSHSTHVNEDYEAKIKDLTLLDGKLETNLFIYHFSDGSDRFFGTGAGSSVKSETNFAGIESGFTYTGNYKLYDDFFFQLGERLRSVRISPGAIGSIPFITELFTFSDVPGINGFTAHAQKIALLYNTLDSQTMPLSGLYGRISAELSARNLGSSTDYRRYEAEAKGFLPQDREKRFITAFRGLYSQVTSNNTPFMEQSIIGGETSLRGYGRNRFIDKTALLFNLEERIRLFRWNLFDVNADWELAPFIDAGAVISSLDSLTGRDFRFTPGIGIRAVVRPNIVGRMDIGFGGEGAAVFIGLGYPF